MTETPRSPEADPQQSLALPPPAASALPPARRGGSLLAGLALLTGVVALGLHFYPAIRSNVERVAGPVKWLPADVQAMVPEAWWPRAGVESSAAYILDRTARLEAEIAAAQTALAELRQASQAATALQLRMDALDREAAAAGERLSTLDARIGTAETSFKSSLSRLEKAVATRGAPERMSLLVARLALASSSRGLSAEDVESLAEAASSDPVLAEQVARLKVLVRQDIPSVASLREGFLARRSAAASEAMKARLGWWSMGLSAARSTLVDFGVSRPPEETRDDLVLAEAARQMELGNLRQALFELDAGSPELKDALSSWIGDARQRVAVDDTLLLLVDAVLARVLSQPGAG